MLKVVTTKATAAEKVKAEVQKVKDKAQAIVDSIAVDKKSAEAKLEAAAPALAAAETALQVISAVMLYAYLIINMRNFTDFMTFFWKTF